MDIYAVVSRGRKSRIGRGFSQGELKEVDLSFKRSLNLGIPIDPMRSSKHTENVEKLKVYLNIASPIADVTLDLTEVKGIGKKRSEKLKAAGFNSVKRLVESEPEDIAEKVGVSEKSAARWIESAKKILSEKA